MSSVRTFVPALESEARKFASARVGQVATAMLVVGIAAICAGMVMAAAKDDPQLAGKLALLHDPGGWAGYLTTASQISAVAGLLGFGVVLSWLVGREFAEGTITGLFALPVSRRAILAAKLAVYGGWVVAVAAVLVLALLGLGFAVALGPLGPDVVPLLLRQFLVTLLTGLLALPAALVATLSRNVLAGVGTVLGLVVAAQVAAIVGAGGWFPFAMPGIWSTSTTPAFAGALPLQCALVLVVGTLCVVLAADSWRRLQLDR
ncbi:ABC transporter permease [Actinopolymorpha pittospori]|uniref:ABC-2 type transport system permease protein n=1 Tax=Actinopolymorpha pittospori TaxID=648752 RepID=A0A927MV69_9ACTN|nr:ABC transporter permease [Actinopolymorpha pittospori]MBE1605413.1 ABC-2 type transport system permease protein [Actinopolymorpha pittospori]